MPNSSTFSPGWPHEPDPGQPSDPAAPGRLRRWSLAASAGLAAFALVNVMACVVYLRWRTELASRVDDPDERAALHATHKIVPHGNEATTTMVKVIALVALVTVVLLIRWAVLALRNRDARYGRSRGFAGAYSPDRWTPGARRTAIGPAWVLWLTALVFLYTSFLRVTGPLGESPGLPGDEQVDVEVDFVHRSIALALVQAACALAVLFVVVRTTRRNERGVGSQSALSRGI
ncbi:hypothetical protein [Yinghuangia seranimata]|uniref:hypothetical protein n=1 Tax=Yinghuangia seranimata TaxID=408067 RepID=UPI00248C13B8|nr:hypothetical protein [Yinghuangia seranimata]MDI2132337.1 hypothetical protein [Yinghuangia seranimata]